MPHTLKYQVANASLATIHRPTEVDGHPATISFRQAAIDLVPVDHSGGTLAIALPPGALDLFQPGAIVTIDVTVAAAPTETTGA